MKMYNPFRWHIISVGGLFMVRRLSVLGWIYANKHDGASVLTLSHALMFASFRDIDNARVLRMWVSEQRYVE
jgi:hypothetical protein